MINLERERSWGGDEIAVFGYLKASPVTGESNEDTMRVLLIGRLLLVMYQQRNNLI